MPNTALDDNKRMNLRVSPDAKAKLVRAAALSNTDLTSFVLQSALREADAAIRQAETLVLSRRDYDRILDLLDNPPAPNARLLAAAKAIPKAR